MNSGTHAEELVYQIEDLKEQSSGANDGMFDLILVMVRKHRDIVLQNDLRETKANLSVAQDLKAVADKLTVKFNTLTGR